MDYTLDDTIVALATAMGGAWRAIVRVSGPRARAIGLKRFRESVPASAGPAASPERRGPSGVTRSLLVPRLAAPLPCTAWTWYGPRSYTGEDLVELHLMGSMPLVELVIADCVAAGARPAGPGEFTLRAFLAGKLDLTAAEAVLGLSDAQNAEQGETALRQLAGGISGPIRRLRDRLLEVLVELEAGLDFVEEDIEFLERRTLQSALLDAAATLGRLDTTMHARSRSRVQRRVVLAGPPNVGKSALFNRLLGRPAALVSARPGSTRDFLNGSLPLGPVSGASTTAIELVDTAGAAEPASAVETETQLQRDSAIREADLVLWCVDTTASDPLAPPADVQCRDHMIVLTKCDLPVPAPFGVRWLDTALDSLGVSSQPQDARAAGPFHGLVQTSAVADLGTDKLLEALRHWLSRADAASGEVLVATATRCRDSIARALQTVGHALTTCQAGGGDELIAADLHLAIDELGKVVGAVYTEDILDRIFRQFCIGK